METTRRPDRLAWTVLRQAASLTEEFARGERRLDRAEFDPAKAERERWLGRKLPDRSPERRN